MIRLTLSLAYHPVLNEATVEHLHTAGTAHHALDLTARDLYNWAGFLGGLPELATYPDFREARRRKGLQVPSASPDR